MGAHAAVDVDVLVGDALGFGDEGGDDAGRAGRLGLGGAHHAVERPEEVDRGGAGGADGLGGNLEVGQSSTVNASGSPANLTIFSQGNSLILGQSTELRAAFYGPSTEVIIDNNTDIYGSVVAGSVNMRNHSCFHYDRALAKKAYGTTGRMLMVAWKEL